MVINADFQSKQHKKKDPTTFVSFNKWQPESPPNTTILLLTMAAACCLTIVEDVLIEDRNFVKVYELI